MATPPPKPLVGPNLFTPGTGGSTAPTIPADVMASWRGLWHAIGSNLPHYVNQSRANRRALRAVLKAHGR